MNYQAIILAAGQGTRMKSALPKVLHSVCGQTLLERSIRAVQGAGAKKVTVVVGTGRGQVEAEIAGLGLSEVDSALQSEQRGTGDAAKAALANIQHETVLILPGDVPLIDAKVISQALTAFTSQTPDLLLLSFEPEDPSGFGRIIRDSSGKVLSICEEKDCTEDQRRISEVNAGIYLCSRELLEKGLASLSTENAQAEYYLTDIVEFAEKQGLKIAALCIRPSESLAGANSRKDLSSLEALRRKQIVETLMDQGVGFEDPMQAYIDEGVKVGKDCFIGAGTRLRGATELGERVRIEGNCLIENCLIGSETEIKLASSLKDSEVGSNSSIGPCAHLRPGSKIGNDVKVGNFVETKKARLHDGVKAGHLSYLGDAEVFANANIGAGTITCNYDGKSKHQTIVGKEAFIGSNSCLVAPVEVGEKSYIAAGSTITKKVPAKALGLARARQTNKEDWND